MTRLLLVLNLCALSDALANGGPFVVKYPNGDPAAKGVLARLGHDLRPHRETQLRVVKEDLSISFLRDAFSGSRTKIKGPPLARVSAEYTITNPIDRNVEIDFGFPILRGVYMRWSHMSSLISGPRVTVRVRGGQVKSTIISNSIIYAIIRARARKVIDAAIAADPVLAELVKAAGERGRRQTAAHRALAAHLTDAMEWGPRDAALLVEYATLDQDRTVVLWPRDRELHAWTRGIAQDRTAKLLLDSNLGVLAAIGEQKATQFFAHLASRFDPRAGAAYEYIFRAWGGDVRERSLDMRTGKVRPREVVVDPKQSKGERGSVLLPTDPTIYARVAYLDPKAKLSKEDRASCKAVLRNLPVVFTFAPMNLLHYRARFPARSTQTVTVEYQQYAYTDTRTPRTYQLAYVVHPASLWDHFGPINLEVAVPCGVRFRASAPLKHGDIEERPGPRGSSKLRCAVYRTVLTQKTGELFVAVDADTWHQAGKKMAARPGRPVVRQ